jgi:hypothetical protein
LDRIQFLEQCEAGARQPAQAAACIQAAQQCRQQIEGSCRRHEMELGVLAKEGLLYPVVHFAGRSKVVFARRVLEIGQKVTNLGVFELPPSAKLLDASKLSPFELTIAQMMNNIIAVSPDGRWAASGTHIYDVNTLKPIRRLPFATRLISFSADGQTVFLFSVEHQSLYTLSDWQKNAPPLEGPTGATQESPKP